MNYIKDNEQIWDKRSDNNDEWSTPVSSEMVNDARNGKWEIVLTPAKKVPRDWFPEDMRGKKVLWLARCFLKNYLDNISHMKYCLHIILERRLSL